MNKRKVIIWGCLIVIFCFGFVVKGYVKNNSDKVIVLRDYGIKTVQSQSDYVFYDNINDILSNSDLVISGDVVDVKEPQKIKMGEAVNNSKEEKVTIDDVYTVSIIKINKVYKGSNHQPGDILEIKQYGGVYEGITHTDKDVTFLKKGNKHIFFLEEYSDSPCSMINPLQGDLIIDKNEVKAKKNIITKNTSEADFELLLKSKIK